MIDIECPSCSVKINVPEKHAGKKVKCPKCKMGVHVPDVPASPDDYMFEDAISDALSEDEQQSGLPPKSKPATRTWRAVNYQHGNSMCSLGRIHSGVGWFLVALTIAVITFGFNSLPLIMLAIYALTGFLSSIPFFAAASVLKCLADIGEFQKQQMQDFRDVHGTVGQ